MFNAIILHAKRGGGKTTTALGCVDRAKMAGYDLRGILSLRVLQYGEYPGYDVLDLKTGLTTALVRPKTIAVSSDWNSIKNAVYNFSISEFTMANEILLSALKGMTPKTLLFLDEYGRIESSHGGLFRGLLGILESENKMGTLVVLCRDDLVEELTNILKNYVDGIRIIEAGDPNKLWKAIEVGGTI